ncbi:unnamed protein product [Choristocarpus tenellus]
MMDAFSVLRESRKRGNATRKRPNTEGSILGVGSFTSARRGSSFTECPICGKYVHSSLVETHVDRCIVSSAGNTQKSPCPTNISPSVPDLTTKATRGLPPDTQAAITRSSGDVFSTLMAASALSNFKEYFYLVAEEDGTFSWGWGSSRNPSSAKTNQTPQCWSCTVTNKGPKGISTGTCELWTNLPPATPTVSGGKNNTNVMPSAGRRLSHLSVPVLKSMIQKNVRRGLPEASVRCFLELAIKSWSDAIRRLLVIIVEDSILHPAAGLVAWLMVATSKGYTPPPSLVGAVLCIVYETTACPVRDPLMCNPAGRTSPLLDRPPPHPRDLLPMHNQEIKNAQNCKVDTTGSSRREAIEDSIVGNGRGEQRAERGTVDPVRTESVCAAACCLRALLMRMTYGGMSCDKDLMRMGCLVWGERFGKPVEWEPGRMTCESPNNLHAPQPPSQEEVSHALDLVHKVSGGIRGQGKAEGPPDDKNPPFGYMHASARRVLGNDSGWLGFLAQVHAGAGMPSALFSFLMRCIQGGTSEHGSRDRMEKSAVIGVGIEAKNVSSPYSGRTGSIIREVDAVASGVDFHCTPILDDVLRSPTTLRKVVAAVEATTVQTAPGRDGNNGSTWKNIEAVKAVVKRAMWTCSSGVNNRPLQLVLTPTANLAMQGSLEGVPDNQQDEACIAVWAAVSREMQSYAKDHISARLSLDDRCLRGG